jgi:hypothetical protein
MNTKTHECFAWDYETDKRVYFDSAKPHCGSCLMEEEYGYFGGFSDDPCCCSHQREYEQMQEETAK